jgi:TolA-binding protein
LLFEGEDDYDIQDTPRPDIHHSDLLHSQRGGRLEASSSLSEKMTSMQNHLLVETIENLSKEMREMHTTINSLAMNLNTVHNQNHELKAGHQRMEKHLLRIGSSQAQARSNDITSPATNANRVPQTNKRDTSTQPKASEETQADNQPGVLPVGQDRWATVAKKGKAVKENNNTPAKRMKRTIILHCCTDAKNDDTDIYHMRDTINAYLNKANAPTSLTSSGMQWNRRGNLTLTTHNKFTEEELAPHLSVIEE